MESLLDDVESESDGGSGDEMEEEMLHETTAEALLADEREQRRGQRRRDRGNEMRARVEMTYDFFENVLWPHMLTHRPAAAGKTTSRQLAEQARGAEARRAVERSRFKPSMVFREICSYIKGSSTALDCECGFLSEEDYCQLGR